MHSPASAAYLHVLRLFAVPGVVEVHEFGDMAYDPESDLENTPDSVFCAHGAGYPVKW